MGRTLPHPHGYLEWNVMLDPHAIVCLLNSGLPIAIYPCATDKDPFAYGRHNTFWKLNNLEFIRHMTPGLRRYLCFAFGRTIKMDFLRAMDEDEPAELLLRVCSMEHKVFRQCISIMFIYRALRSCCAMLSLRRCWISHLEMKRFDRCLIELSPSL